MKTISLTETIGTDREVQFTGGISYRLLLERDKMGYSFHITHVKKGKWQWHYPHHLESCYCVSGVGVLTNLETLEEHQINPGTLYVLNEHKKHTFEAKTDTVLISVFNPPIVGNEAHDENGIYQLIKPKNDRI